MRVFGLIILVSIFMCGCGGGTSTSSSGTTVNTGLPVAQAQSKATATNQAVLNLVQNTSPFLEAPPSASSIQRIHTIVDDSKKLKVIAMKTAFGIPMSRRKSARSIQKSKGFSSSNNQGTYTVRVFDTDSVSTAFDLNLNMTFKKASGQIILDENFTDLHRIDFTVSGYETIDGIRFNYTNASFFSTLLSSTSFSLAGSGTISTSDGGSFSLNVSGISVSLSTGRVTGGQIVIAGNDGEKNIQVTSTFQTNGVPIVEVQDSGNVVSSQAAELPNVTINNGAVTFASTSALITHPYIGDLVTGGTKVYSGYFQTNTETIPISGTISKSNAIAKVCNVNTRRYYTIASTDTDAVAIEGYVAEDTSGVLYSFGSNEYPVTNCNNVSISLPNPMSNGVSWNEDYEGLAATSTVMGSDLTYQGFTGLKWVRTSASGIFEGVFATIVADSYYNTQYGEAFTEGNISAQGESAYFQLRRVP